MKNTTMENDVLLSGYFGFGNTGDEAILTGSVLAFQQAKLRVGVMSRTPSETANTLEVQGYPRSGFFPLLRAIRASELILSGGGGLFQDSTSLRSLIFYLRVPFLAKLFKKKTMIFAQGIGPLNTSIGKRFTR